MRTLPSSITSATALRIFAAILFSFSLWLPVGDNIAYDVLLTRAIDLKYLTASLIILFFIGVKDDIIGVFGDKKRIGKSVTSDLQENKKTLLLWYAWKNGNKKDNTDRLVEVYVPEVIKEAASSGLK